jgi:ribose 1,5-bisphosphokinase
MARIMIRGTLLCVIGPSGAGKDTLIGEARRRLAGDPGVHFARRIVTRPSSPAEDHDSLDEGTFERSRAGGRFALSWRAHGLGYALPASILPPLHQGACVVSNVSRLVVADAQRRFPAVRVALVTAPSDVLAARLAARGREEPDVVAARLAREVAVVAGLDPDLTIINVGSIDAKADELVSFIRTLRRADRDDELPVSEFGEGEAS